MMMINSSLLSILPPALVFLVAPACLAFSIPSRHIHSTNPWQHLTMMTGQGWRGHIGSTYVPFHFMVSGNNDKDNEDNTDQTFPFPTMNLSGDVPTPDGKTVTNDDIDDQLDQILAFKDMFELSRNAPLEEENDGQTFSNDDIDDQLNEILAFKDMFEESKNAPLKEEDEGFLESPTKKVRATVKGASPLFAPKFSPPTTSVPAMPSKNATATEKGASPVFAPKFIPPTTYVPAMPSKDATGVEPYVTSICATISQQIYNATNITSFDLINKNDKNATAKVIIFDNHGVLNDLIPPFAVAVSGRTMILAWRGSQTIMDWASDFSASPVSSSRWSKISAMVKAHSGYSSLVESDMAMHEDVLIKTIKSGNIAELVTTGHSLAGGMAQVCHVFLEAQLQKTGSPWNALRGKLTVRSIAFAAPMTIMSTMDFASADTPTNSFLRKISINSCNIVYGPDVVPHATGDTPYVIAAIKAVIPDVANKVPSWSWLLRIFGIPSKLADKFENLTQNNEEVKKLLKVIQQYNHIGKIIHYTDDSPNPVELRDDQFQSVRLPLFRGNTRIKVPTKSRTAGTVEKQLTKAHLYFPSAFAYNLLKDKQGTK